MEAMGMSDIAKIIGQRIRNYRTQKGLSQEKLAELAGCHPTYIGQLERGEKNATLESVEKIASAMDISLSELFDKLGKSGSNNIAAKCYDLVASKNEAEQKQLYKMLQEMDKYKNQ
jgi:transcriptional regulator with XRE-family HTH domain